MRARQMFQIVWHPLKVLLTRPSVSIHEVVLRWRAPDVVLPDGAVSGSLANGATARRRLVACPLRLLWPRPAALGASPMAEAQIGRRSTCTSVAGAGRAATKT